MEYNFTKFSSKPLISSRHSSDDKEEFINLFEFVKSNKIMTKPNPGWDNFSIEILQGLLNIKNYSIINITNASPYEINRICSTINSTKWGRDIPFKSRITGTIDDCNDEVWAYQETGNFFFVEENVEPILLNFINDIIDQFEPKNYTVFVDDVSVVNEAYYNYLEIVNDINIFNQRYTKFINTSEIVHIYHFSSKDDALEFKLSI